MKLPTLFIILSILLSSNLYSQSITTPIVEGRLKKWHTLRFIFEGPQCSETDFSPNPFLDYRLEVTFTNGNKTFKESTI